jgi:magnesium chelatase subunit I
LSLEDGIRITRENAWLDRASDGRKIEVPRYMLEIIEEFCRIARKSPHINQQSGVSVRASVAGAELLVSNAERRCILAGEAEVVPRISDLHHLPAACRGKIELMLAEDERAEDKVIASITGEAVQAVFERYGQVSDLEEVVDAFADRSTTVQIGDEVSTKELVSTVESIPVLKEAVVKLCRLAEIPADNAAYLASAAEFVLEALYVNNRLSKYAYHGKTFFKR